MPEESDDAVDAGNDPAIIIYLIEWGADIVDRFWQWLHGGDESSTEVSALALVGPGHLPPLDQDFAFVMIGD